MKERILIRVDGNAEIGLGHLVRCNALAQMLKDEYAPHFYSKDIPEGLEEEIKKNGFGLSKINSEEEFLAKAKEDKIVILDHYSLDSEYQNTIKRNGAKLVCIDDLHDKKFHADLIINHAPGVTAEDYDAEPYTVYALGTDYAMLRPQFLNLKEKKRKTEKIKRLFICFGGSDQQNLTRKTLEHVLDYEEIEEISVVTGTSYPHLDDLEDFVQSDQRIKHQHDLNEEQILEEMLWADLAIVPASGILYEVIATNTPVITGSYVENQKYFLEQFSALPSVKSAGNFGKGDFKTALEDFLASEEIEVPDIIDGRSPERILNKIKKLK